LIAEKAGKQNMLESWNARMLEGFKAAKTYQLVSL
jgi:hypothetical protein